MLSLLGQPLPKTQALTYPRLVGDVGGTNVRFGMIMGPDASPSHVRTLQVKEFIGLKEAIQAYLHDLEQAGELPDYPGSAAIALATPVDSDAIEMINNHWQFSRDALQHALGMQALLLLNDFAALALSLPRLSPDQLIMDRERQGRGNTMAVLGPGTGLGVAGVLRTPRGYLALPSEGGHATLAPTDDYESELLAIVRREFSHVSAERLLSGIGLPILHRAVSEVLGQKTERLRPETIVERGAQRTDSCCIATLESFCSLLGSFAGNVALTLGARGGVYIGGGIVPRFPDLFLQSRFRNRFEAKGRFRPYLEQIPVHLVTDTMTALEGAACALDQWEVR